MESNENLTEGFKRGSMREVINSIFTILRRDEELMRALHYPSEDSVNALVKHPMSKDYANIVNESDENYWKIVDTHIKLYEKSTDIESESVCRIYIYMGRRRPVFNSYLMAKQEVIIDVFVHNDYSDDLRMEWINDRINELLSLEHLQGAIGYLDYASGRPWQAPRGYSKYQSMFVFGASKK